MTPMRSINGVFHLQPDHPEFDRIHALLLSPALEKPQASRRVYPGGRKARRSLVPFSMRDSVGEAIRRKARVWFIARKPDLALLDVMAARSAPDSSHRGGEGDDKGPGAKEGQKGVSSF
jgi:hypothetical protein